eukprot:comp22176_c1_seq1/m.32559 comp22176_c1_seq1/g.32559  ORF comp22176_c1_seq1/g.32559 comp22176_c1_seq1/m.32559 type:complete len:530 (-) comp22176_c1_seq1:82-1671(-)
MSQPSSLLKVASKVAAYTTPKRVNSPGVERNANMSSNSLTVAHATWSARYLTKLLVMATVICVTFAFLHTNPTSVTNVTIGIGQPHDGTERVPIPAEPAMAGLEPASQMELRDQSVLQDHAVQTIPEVVSPPPQPPQVVINVQQQSPAAVNVQSPPANLVRPPVTMQNSGPATVTVTQAAIPPPPAPATPTSIAALASQNKYLQFYNDPEFTSPKPIAPHGWEPKVPLAFLMSAHSDETINGVANNIRILYHPSHVYVVHVDAKVTQEWVDVLNRTFGHLPNFLLVNERVDVKWGQWSIVEMQQNQMTTALTLPGWIAAVNLCGSTMPLKSLRQIDAYLNKVFLEEGKMVLHYEQGLPPCHPRTPWFHYMCKRTPARCLNRECTKMSGTPNNQPVYKGDNWMVVSREFAKYATTSEDGKAWAQFFNGTSMPDESFYQTLIANSPVFSEKIRYPNGQMQSNRIVYLYWWYAPCKSYPQTRSGSPCYLGEKDWKDEPFKRAVVEPATLFARKVYANEPIRQRIEGILRLNA